MQVFQRISLSNHTDVIFKSKDLANPDTVNRLRIRKNNANGTRLYRSINALAFRAIV